MRKPNLGQDFDNGDGTYDYEGYEDAMDNYADAERDAYLEKLYDEGDQIHEQRRSEKDEMDK